MKIEAFTLSTLQHLVRRMNGLFFYPSNIVKGSSQQKFSAKGNIVNILGFAQHMVSVANLFNSAITAPNGPRQSVNKSMTVLQ